MQSATEPEHRMLRAKTLECATLMGVAVGKEMFANDAIEIMNVLKGMEDAGMRSDDPQIAYTLTRWVAVTCQVLDVPCPVLALGLALALGLCRLMLS
jgi:hypothetical protein